MPKLLKQKIRQPLARYIFVRVSDKTKINLSILSQKCNTNDSVIVRFILEDFFKNYDLDKRSSLGMPLTGYPKFKK
jgi:hypothetical protein